MKYFVIGLLTNILLTLCARYTTLPVEYITKNPTQNKKKKPLKLSSNGIIGFRQD